MNVLVIDNYDSFTYNLVQYLERLGASVDVVRNDAMTADEAIQPDRWPMIMISPGPGDPDGAGISLDVIARAAEARIPLLGVCLGHQSIVQHFGGRIVNAATIMHGKTSAITHNGAGVFTGLADPLTVVRYHSLAADRQAMPECLQVTATAPDGEIMGVRHNALPIQGVQFHPESIASEGGLPLLKNWLEGR